MATRAVQLVTGPGVAKAIPRWRFCG